jgi:hypothetical protein
VPRKTNGVVKPLADVDRQVVLAYHGSDAFPGRIKLLRGQKKDGNQSEVTQWHIWTELMTGSVTEFAELATIR